MSLGTSLWGYGICGVWGQTTYLDLFAVLPGPSWTLGLELFGQEPHQRKASGVGNSLPQSRSDSRIPASLQSQQPVLSLLTPAPGEEKLALGSHFELSLVFTLHFPRRPECLLINPEHGSASVGLACPFPWARLLSLSQTPFLLSRTRGCPPPPRGAPRFHGYQDRFHFHRRLCRWGPSRPPRSPSCSGHWLRSPRTPHLIPALI